MRIRRATQADAALVAAAEAETARSPGLLVQRPGEIPTSAFAAKIDALRDRGYYVVAEDEGRVVGHAFLDPFELEANSHVFRLNVVVHPGHTGKGIGKLLLADLLEWAREHGVGKIELLVRATNERAIGLYREFSFVEEGRLHGRVKLSDGRLIDDLAMAWFPARSDVR